MDKKKQKAISYIIFLKGYIAGLGKEWEDRRADGRKKRKKPTTSQTEERTKKKNSRRFKTNKFASDIEGAWQSRKYKRK